MKQRLALEPRPIEFIKEPPDFIFEPDRGYRLRKRQKVSSSKSIYQSGYNRNDQGAVAAEGKPEFGPLRDAG